MGKFNLENASFSNGITKKSKAFGRRNLALRKKGNQGKAGYQKKTTPPRKKKQGKEKEDLWKRKAHFEVIEKTIDANTGGKKWIGKSTSAGGKRMGGLKMGTRGDPPRNVNQRVFPSLGVLFVERSDKTGRGGDVWKGICERQDRFKGGQGEKTLNGMWGGYTGIGGGRGSN